MKTDFTDCIITKGSNCSHSVCWGRIRILNRIGELLRQGPGSRHDQKVEVNRFENQVKKNYCEKIISVASIPEIDKGLFFIMTGLFADTLCKKKICKFNPKEASTITFLIGRKTITKFSTKQFILRLLTEIFKMFVGW